MSRTIRRALYSFVWFLALSRMNVYLNQLIYYAFIYLNSECMFIFLRHFEIKIRRTSFWRRKEKNGCRREQKSCWLFSTIWQQLYALSVRLLYTLFGVDVRGFIVVVDWCECIVESLKLNAILSVAMQLKTLF